MTQTYLSWRTIFLLCASTFALALVAALPGLTSSGVAIGGTITITTLPANLLIMSLALAIFAGPLFFKKNDLNAPLPEILFRAGIGGLWLGVATLFVLNLAGRAIPMEDSGSLVAAAICMLLTATSILLSAIWYRASLTLLLAWLVLLPVSAYLLTDVFLSGPAGGSPLTDLQTPEAATLRAWNHWALQLSPGTFALGALTGKLLDGSACSIPAGLTGLFAAFGAAVIAFRIVHSPPAASAVSQAAQPV